ncbi:MAG: hypothetical protein IT457_20450 [Planctomycetes bacterium]|nr:hypothetical protein [Planctomycetota bacterium]
MAMQPKPRGLEHGNVLTAQSGRPLGHGARYFGYGVMEAYGSGKKGTRDGQLTRACLPAPFDFAVEMRARGLTPEDRGSVESALIALGVLGGIGAKSRKGYGSLVLQKLRVDGEDRWCPPESIDRFRTTIAALHAAGSVDCLPEFTAFWRGARHVLLSAGEVEPLELLDRIGREMVRFRSWGRERRILGDGVDSERRFRDDHDLMKAQVVSRTRHPQRIAFGLPHNYGRNFADQVGPTGGLDRRASPLFVHIHTCGTTPVAVVSFFPARFLPRDGSQISVGGKVVAQAPEESLFKPLHAFLDRLLGKSTGDERRREDFTEAMEVRP